MGGPCLDLSLSVFTSPALGASVYVVRGGGPNYVPLGLIFLSSPPPPSLPPYTVFKIHLSHSPVSIISVNHFHLVFLYIFLLLLTLFFISIFALFVLCYFFAPLCIYRYFAIHFEALSVLCFQCVFFPFVFVSLPPSPATFLPPPRMQSRWRGSG